MGILRHGLRAELSAILDVDPVTLQQTRLEPSPPTEPTTTRLSALIHGSLAHKDEVRTVYEFLPTLMLRIFGYAPGHGWLETASELPSKDREPLLQFISPDGPLHTFCLKNSPSRDAKMDLAKDLRYEFLRSNLPRTTDRALEQGPALALNKTFEDGPSYLAPFLAPYLNDKNDSVVYLSPIDYFYICMIASPTRKLSATQGGVPYSGKRMRRSSSLPSTRALYNQTIASYALTLKTGAQVNSDSIFIAASLDFLFLTWSTVNREDTQPPVSTATAEAIASIMLALAPQRPSHLDLEADYHPSKIPEFLDWKAQTNCSALYRASEFLLESVLTHYEPSSPDSTLIAYYRIVALYIAPWRTSVRKSLVSSLFPKKKSSTSRNGTDLRSASIAAFTLTLSSINAHIASSSRSPGNASAVREHLWREELRTRQSCVDDLLVRLAIVRAANRRFPSTHEGNTALSLVADAASAAKLSGNWDGPGKEQDKAEELRNCLVALRDQKAEHDRVNSRRTRNYVHILSASMGVRMDDGGMLRGITDMVGVSGPSTMAGVVNMVSRGSGRRTSRGSSKKRIHERRMSALRSMDGGSIPLLGDVWDQPIADDENEFVVVWLYRIALWFEQHLGFLPDLRRFARFWHVFVASVLICSAYLVRGVCKMIWAA